jgi:hypothetical protein
MVCDEVVATKAAARRPPRIAPAGAVPDGGGDHMLQGFKLTIRLGRHQLTITLEPF